MASATDRKDLLLEAGLALSSELSLPVILQRIVDLAAHLTDARYGALGVLGSNGEINDFITTGLSMRERGAIGPLPRGRGILGVLIHDARPLRLERIAGDARSIGFPANHPPMTTFLGAPVKARGRVFGNIYLTDKRDGRHFTQEDEDDLIVLATQAGVAIANATLYEEAHQRERWLNALRQTTVAIMADEPIESVLALICRLARELAEADLAMLVTSSDQPGRLVVASAEGAYDQRLRGLDVPLEGSISGEVMRTGRPVVLENANLDTRTYQPMVQLGQMGPSIFVPLVVRGHPFGTVAVSSLVGAPPFPASAVRLVETFAEQASVALDVNRSRRDAERVAILEDRERIAKDLHDGIIQSLFAVGMGLQGTAATVPGTDAEARLEGAVKEIDRVIRDLRNYIFGLRPGLLADRQLDQALGALAREVSERSGLKVVLEVDSAVAAELSPKATELLHLTREALSNVQRHADASECVLSLQRSGTEAVLNVRDNGRGFDISAVRLGQGIANMRDRVKRLGGRVRVVTAPGKGTRLRVVIPL
jgi:two-component system, NarL family, sensor histidine kinase DevS